MTTAVRSSGMPEALAGRLDDPQVGLVRHHQGDVVGPEPGVGHGPLGRLDHHADGAAEDLLAVHEQRAAVLALEKVLDDPSEFRFQLSRLPGPSTGSTTTAPAPSPTMMAILRSSMSVILDSVSEPTSSIGPEPTAIRPATVTRP